MMQHDKQTISNSICPVDQLEWFVNHTLSTEDMCTVEEHLKTCATCRTKTAEWMALRQAMQEISIQTPEPRADLFSRIEAQIDLVPVRSPQSRLYLFHQGCKRALSVCGEHCWAQARLIRRELFWIPLFLLPLICAIIYLPETGERMPGTAGLLVALLTAFGMAFIYGQEVDPAREVTLVTPTSPRLVLGIRCGLVFGYNLLLNCGLVLPFLSLQGIVTPAWFLVNWLAPLCCLSAIALLLSVLLNASSAMVVCSILWAVRLLESIQAFLFGRGQQSGFSWQQHYESFWHQGPLLFVVAVFAILLSFIVIERKEHFAR